jgi:hypothetical protein
MPLDTGKKLNITKYTRGKYEEKIKINNELEESMKNKQGIVRIHLRRIYRRSCKNAVVTSQVRVHMGTHTFTISCITVLILF